MNRPRRPEHEVATLETDDRLPSGPWTGFYIQWGRKGPQELGLTFSEGIITGGGGDAAGAFVVAEVYDTETGRCSMTKRYPGQHTVEYDGFIDHNGIWGRWVIRYAPMMRDDRGHFHIWPLGMNAGMADEAAEEVPVAIAVGGGEFASGT